MGKREVPVHEARIANHEVRSANHEVQSANVLLGHRRRTDGHTGTRTHAHTHTHTHTHTQTDCNNPRCACAQARVNECLHMHPFSNKCSGHIPTLIIPRRACAARVTVVVLSVCLCVCVCRRLFWHYRLRGGPLAIPADSELREPEK